MPFLGSVYQVFGLYPEVYHAMICMEMKDEECESDEKKEESHTEK
ncbi:phosphonate ABC transporter permease [Bacillus manliponensis]|uniref:Phosphonate ABC transporter permease n=1 Tax=Bacillus manliponensis TaxID=574376 RepID=A0A073JUT0_9BACI|nr:hypothetical protein [Bacillus manliponensis]KEK18814.1 phosphonate ABC transporter permease [Bacillus manliponensis]